MISDHVFLPPQAWDDGKQEVYYYNVDTGETSATAPCRASVSYHSPPKEQECTVDGTERSSRLHIFLIHAGQRMPLRAHCNYRNKKNMAFFTVGIHVVSWNGFQ